MGPSAEDRGLYENSSTQKNKSKTESQRGERGIPFSCARAYLDLPGVYPRTPFRSGRLGTGADRGPEAGVAGGGGDQGLQRPPDRCRAAVVFARQLCHRRARRLARGDLAPLAGVQFVGRIEP